MVEAMDIIMEDIPQPEEPLIVEDTLAEEGDAWEIVVVEDKVLTRTIMRSVDKATILSKIFMHTEIPMDEVQEPEGQVEHRMRCITGIRLETGHKPY